MDRYSRGIYFGIFLIIALIGVLVAAATRVRFPVDLDGRITHIQGDVTIGAPGQTPVAVKSSESGSRTVRAGDQIRVEPGGAATVMFFNDGVATLSGPAQLVVRESSRHGTALDHIRRSGSAEEDITLVIAQSAGTVDYRFDRAEPAFDGLTIRVQLPNDVYIPTTPCWQIAIDAEGQASSRAVTCPSP